MSYMCFLGQTLKKLAPYFTVTTLRDIDCSGIEVAPSEETNMRFLHTSAVPIKEFIRAKRLHVMRCDIDGVKKPMVVPATEVSDFFEKSQTAWGTRAPYYLCVRSADQQQPRSPEEAVRQIVQSSVDEFLLEI